MDESPADLAPELRVKVEKFAGLTEQMKRRQSQITELGAERRTIGLELLETGKVSRADLARASGLSPQAVARTLAAPSADPVETNTKEK